MPARRVAAGVLMVGLAALAVGTARAQTLMKPPVFSAAAGEILQQVLGGGGPQELELRSRPFFFPVLDGSTLAVSAFRIGRQGLLFGARDEAGVDADGMPVEVAGLELFGAVLHDGAELRRFGDRFLLPRSGVADGVSVPYSFPLALMPGRYEIVWGIRDEVSGRATARRDVLEVPSFTDGGLRLSSIVVAGGYRAAPGITVDGAVAAGVRVFTASFDDDLDRSLDRAATPEISLAFFVVNAATNQESGTVDLQIDYRILDEDDTSVLRFSPQLSSRTTISQPIPIAEAADLEIGRAYRFEITVRDRVEGIEAVQLVPFRLRR